MFLAGYNIDGAFGSKVLNWKYYFDPRYPFGITCFGKASASGHKKIHPGGVKDINTPLRKYIYTAKTRHSSSPSRAE